MLSNGVTASSDSVIPAPNPATTVRGPDTLPSASARSALYVSNATNRIPALNELPMINVVQPAYHCRPNGGHGSFLESGNRRLSCMRVFANSAGYVMVISTAPAVEPAMIDRNTLGLGLGLMSSWVAIAGAGFADGTCGDLHWKAYSFNGGDEQCRVTWWKSACRKDLSPSEILGGSDFPHSIFAMSTCQEFSNLCEAQPVWDKGDAALSARD